MKPANCSMFWAAMIWGLSAMFAMAGTVSVTDMTGREVETPFDPKRIVCIGPGALRLIVYLQAESKVVGVEAMEKKHPDGRPYWIAHPQLSRLPRCGTGGPASINKKPDLEAVLAVAPQVVLVTYMKAPLADEVQQILKIPVVVLNCGAFAAFDEAAYDALRIAGKILNREARAEQVFYYIESLRKDLHLRTINTPNNNKPSVYVGAIGYRGPHGIESTERQYIPIDWINAHNAAEQLKATVGSHLFLDRETLIRLNPDIIFIDGGGMHLVMSDYRKRPSFYSTLKAFAQDRVYTLLPYNRYATNIGTALANAYAIGKILYPNQFEDVDPQRRADEIYTFLVGSPVYSKMQQDYGPIGGAASFRSD